jgi:hypothetical protein
MGRPLHAIVLPFALLAAACSSGKVVTGVPNDGGTARFDVPARDAWLLTPVPDVRPASNCPASCPELEANCGTVTDTRCGGTIECGDCPTGQACGLEVHNVCTDVSGPTSTCKPKTCAEQEGRCGSTDDGCGGTLDCGGCQLPQICGGDPSKPGRCGCIGLCALVPACTAGATTSLSGSVFDPAGLHPVPNALVYVPNDAKDPGLAPFPAGVVCEVCGTTAAGRPLVSALTGSDGSFTLPGVPSGVGIPLVVQVGRWRRQLSVDVPKPCASNSLPGRLTLPKNQSEGDLPRIAILTGGFDPVECTLRKMGVDDREFTNPGGGGRINFFMGDEAGRPDDSQSMRPGRHGTGVRIDQNTPPQSALFARTGGVPLINQYDIVILECEGYPQAQQASELAALHDYANAGGRVFVSDYAYTWLYQNGDFAQAAKWHVDQRGDGASVSSVAIEIATNPKGPAFAEWLEAVGLSTPGSHALGALGPVFQNTDGVVPPTQPWLAWISIDRWVLHFTFNTPIGASAGRQCGRVVYSDWHAEFNAYSRGKTFPGECPSADITTAQSILEFMLFDLSSCVQPYTPVCTPRTCADLGVECGPAGDGCGGLLSCGSCNNGDRCGGGGSGKCGAVVSCAPATCASQQIACGPAGDGCGGRLDCGQCPTGDMCGYTKPGQCGHATIY